MAFYFSKKKFQLIIYVLTGIEERRHRWTKRKSLLFGMEGVKNYHLTAR
jgi:hypothetical protein